MPGPVPGASLNLTRTLRSLMNSVHFTDEETEGREAWQAALVHVDAEENQTSQPGHLASEPSGLKQKTFNSNCLLSTYNVLGTKVGIVSTFFPPSLPFF